MERASGSEDRFQQREDFLRDLRAKSLYLPLPNGGCTLLEGVTCDERRAAGDGRRATLVPPLRIAYNSFLINHELLPTFEPPWL